MARSAARAASKNFTTLQPSGASCPHGAGWANRFFCCCGASACALADVQLAVHAGGLVAVDRAVERVVARLQGHGDSRRTTLARQGALRVGASVDGDVVLK